MLRRGFVIFFVFLLLIATVVSVWALWRNQPTADVVNPAVQAQKLLSVEATGALLPQQQALYQRLQQRLLDNPEDYEATLLQSLLFFQIGRLDDAIAMLRDLTQKAPKFQLAHLVYGDLLVARFEPLQQLGGTKLMAALDSKQGEHQVANLRSEALARLRGYQTLLQGQKIPSAFIALDSTIKYALLVDKSANRLYIYRNVGTGLPPKLVDDYYVVVGQKPGNKYSAGDLKTPSGVYFVTGHISDKDLPIKYGTGAFPVNYPNTFDLHLQKTGHGIWLHGTDKSLYSRPPRDTEGCVALTNEELLRIGRYIEPGVTPVVISGSVTWISGRQWLDQNVELQSMLESWRSSWEHRDLDQYLSSYSRDFWSKDNNLSSWKKYKSRVLRGKRNQNIALRGVSLFGYPQQGSEGRNMVVATFLQKYRSNNYNGDMDKKLYLVKEDRRWKILYEGK
ncbi:L,D-transpeptidase Cds6 family protein [Geopsychrobacter electrodiphilus]|uniref:L,D-transpeptidase Cds6 family protein n=1 Tax=Geopsychrobacter electrodiphilus TaxID=225196 RepID=UPI00036EC222|nr:L,D-transpeptidase family protein [Geopsychrobacter electrodiphilus]